ncbi:hypothetical protein COLO4_19890 [Corchorus olitorius]|uniref:Uncharacterized protein n=1 Tax=Corchorus olitorius TaxID=93759 RepID=A0A1R3J2W9_9ROSI|nr:hypothetical protein COLO4_19890 [Corchorus olitorius]
MAVTVPFFTLSPPLPLSHPKPLLPLHRFPPFAFLSTNKASKGKPQQKLWFSSPSNPDHIQISS